MSGREDAGATTGDEGASPPGRLARTLRGLLRRLPDRRPLQIAEVAAAAVEAVRNQALEGVVARYLPAVLEIAVSREDHRYLAPFRDHLAEAVREELRALPGTSAGGPWRPTVEPVGVELLVDAALAPAAPPRVGLHYPEGVRRASWSASGPGRGTRLPAGTGLTLVLTMVEGEGTALQESVEVWLGLELPLPLVEAAAGRDERLQVRGGRLVDGAGTPWPGGGRGPSVEPPPMPPRAAGALPLTWDGPWVRLETANGRPLLWCPGGVLILGREPESAHLVPAHPAPVLSAAHLALWRDGARIVACDLASTNGTVAAGSPLTPGRPIHLTAPAILQAGSRGTLVIEVRRQ